MNNPKV